MKEIYIVKGCYGYNGKRVKYYQNKSNLDKAWSRLVKLKNRIIPNEPAMQVYFADDKTPLHIIKYP